MEVCFSKLPENSKVWIYTTDRELSNNEVNEIKKHSLDFLNNWTSHGIKVEGSILLPYNHFIVICASQENSNLSGCSIDDSIRFINDIEENFNISLLNREIIAFKDGDNIKKINLKNLKDEVIAGNLHPNTIVFNNLIESKKDYMNIWETSASKTWLKRFLVN